jgi:hypothetical protein
LGGASGLPDSVVGQVAAGFEGQRLEVHARRVEVLVLAAPGVDAVEAADHVAVDHVDDRLGDGLVERLEGVHAFLDDHFADLQAFLDHAHLVALLAVQRRSPRRRRAPS